MRNILLLLFFFYLQAVFPQQTDSLKPGLPEGWSFSGKLAYNRPFDLAATIEHYSYNTNFKNSASAGFGFAFRKNRFALLPALCFIYTEGSLHANESRLSYFSELSASFYLGRINAELILSRITGKRKRWYLGGGPFVGRNIYEVITGSYVLDSYVYTSPGASSPVSFRKVQADAPPFWYAGMLLDIRYSFKSAATHSFMAGARFSASTKILKNVFSYVRGNLEPEIYFTYNFWKKNRKPRKEKVKKEKKEPVNWNGQYDNK